MTAYKNNADPNLEDIISATRESAQALNELADLLEQVEKKCEELVAKQRGMNDGHDI